MDNKKMLLRGCLEIESEDEALAMRTPRESIDNDRRRRRLSQDRPSAGQIDSQSRAEMGNPA